MGSGGTRIVTYYYLQYKYTEKFYVSHKRTRIKFTDFTNEAKVFSSYDDALAYMEQHAIFLPSQFRIIAI